jgi:hypothetical protein
VQQCIERIQRELLVFRGMFAKGLGQDGIGAVAQPLKSRIPAIMDVGRVEHAQLLDAQLYLVDGTGRTSLVGFA